MVDNVSIRKKISFQLYIFTRVYFNVLCKNDILKITQTNTHNVIYLLMYMYSDIISIGVIA